MYEYLALIKSTILEFYFSGSLGHLIAVTAKNFTAVKNACRIKNTYKIYTAVYRQNVENLAIVSWHVINAVD